MEPCKILPKHYVTKGTLNINHDLPVLLLLNLAGLVLLIASGWLVLRAAFWLRPAEAGPALAFQIQNGVDGLKFVAAILLITVGMLIVHEAIHGLFFWLFTGSRPKFGIGLGYAFAAAPEWYLPRNLYFIVGIAPLVLITLMGLILLAIVPPAWFLPLLALISFNASGAVGDLAVAVWLIKQPPTCLACDSGSSVTLYVANNDPQ